MAQFTKQRHFNRGCGYNLTSESHSHVKYYLSLLIWVPPHDQIELFNTYAPPFLQLLIILSAISAPRVWLTIILGFLLPLSRFSVIYSSYSMIHTWDLEFPNSSVTAFIKVTIFHVHFVNPLYWIAIQEFTRLTTVYHPNRHWCQRYRPEEDNCISGQSIGNILLLCGMI